MTNISEAKWEFTICQKVTRNTKDITILEKRQRKKRKERKKEKKNRNQCQYILYYLSTSIEHLLIILNIIIVSVGTKERKWEISLKCRERIAERKKEKNKKKMREKEDKKKREKE